MLGLNRQSNPFGSQGLWEQLEDGYDKSMEFDAGDVYELICDCHGWEFWQDRDGRIYRVYE